MCISLGFSVSGKIRLSALIVIMMVWPTFLFGGDKVEYLSDVILTELDMDYYQGWGYLGLDSSIGLWGKERGDLTIGKKVYKKGLGHHAFGGITIDLQGRYKRFEAEVGGGWPGGFDGQVIAKVIVDGQEKFNSGKIGSLSEPMKVDVDIAGAQKLVLSADEADDGRSDDTLTWADARLTRDDSKELVKKNWLDITAAATVVTNDPARKQGTKAGRVEEFPAEDLEMDKELVRDSNGVYEPGVYESGESVIGLTWMERRKISNLEVEFADGSAVPAAGDIKLEFWYEKSMWHGNYSLWQGDYEAVNAKVSVDGNKMSFLIDPQDMVKARVDFWAGIGIQKLRFIFPKADRAVAIKGIKAYSFSQEGQTVVNLMLERPGDVKSAKISIYNGEIIGKSDDWDFSQPLELRLKYKASGLSLADKTVLRLEIDDKAFGVYIDDVLKDGAVYYEGAGVYVTKANYRLSVDDYKKEFLGKPTILDQVRVMPDQSFGQAMEKVHRSVQDDSPTMLSLACDNRKFIVKEDTQIYKYGNLNADKPGTFRVVPKFGSLEMKDPKRYLLGGWQPVLVNEYVQNGVRYKQTSFVADFNNEPMLDRPWWYSEKPLFVSEFEIINETEEHKSASVRLDFDGDVFQKLKADLVRVDGGVTAVFDGKLKAFADTVGVVMLDAKVEGSELFVCGELAGHVTEKVTLYVPGWDVSADEYVCLTGYDKLLQRTQSYWNRIIADGMQIDIPEPMLLNVLRASVVHCLLAARNEDSGKYVSPWVGSDRYGALESESQAILVGLDEMGQSDFARSGLEFFLAKYNDKGLLTTGYTLTGTGQHLNSMARHFALTGDEKWAEKNTPTVLKACEWIVSQIEKTKRKDVSGNNVYYYGLFPPGVTADWSRYRFDSSLNSKFYQGLKASAVTLEKLGNPHAKEISEKADRFKGDFFTAYKWSQARSPLQKIGNAGWQMYDPAIIGCFGMVGEIFDHEDGNRASSKDSGIGINLMFKGLIDAVPSKEVDGMLSQPEETLFLYAGHGDYPEEATKADWFNLGGFGKMQPYYCKSAAVYAMLDDVKPFIRAYFNPIGSLLDTENLSFWEHFHNTGGWNKTHETGWFLQQSRAMFVTERGGELWLAPFVTTGWMDDGEVVEVKNAPSNFGQASYKITSHVKDGFIEATISVPNRCKADAVVIRLRHPQEKKMTAVMVNGKEYKNFDAEKEIVRLKDFDGQVTVRAQY
ncbi:MAG TPA: NPCBM/NEW2 domain-containing protein [Sedimentisphaerales bacterium]|nr:NPCBM/NEW2 domain-containing protein [Sedimentisphaerales bacterium]